MVLVSMVLVSMVSMSMACSSGRSLQLCEKLGG